MIGSLEIYPTHYLLVRNLRAEEANLFTVTQGGGQSWAELYLHTQVSLNAWSIHYYLSLLTEYISKENLDFSVKVCLLYRIYMT